MLKDKERVSVDAHSMLAAEARVRQVSSGQKIGNVKKSRDSARQQYTLKGIEPQTLDLVRDAAEFEGMRINSWVSTRMKEAAQRSLGLDMQIISGSMIKDDFSLADFVKETESRLRELERDIHNVLRVQRSMLVDIINVKV